MAEEQKNGLTEALETGASAAHLARGAVKAGKAVSGAAKGAAVGGPYGAAAGALWEGRKFVGKFLAAAAVLLLLPVLFVLMLPGLIFDGFSSAFSPADTENPILNSEAAIIENANTITFTISGILGEGMEDVMERIGRDFAASDGDEMEVINPYETSPVYNANLFVSQYCAAKDKEFADISISDMAAVMRRGKSHLYSYRRTEEMREKTVEDPETGEDTTVSEKWMIYTISYNGEDYFADQVFSLTEEQRELAADYAQNLSLFLGDGLVQNLENWEGNSIPSLGGETVDPERMARWAYENGYWCKGSGSYHALIPGAAENWGLAVSGCTPSEPQRLLDALADGKLVVAIMSKGHFTSGGHFIVLRGVKDGKILVADPASYKRSGQLWDLSIILNEASRRAGAGGPFWIIG